MTDANKQKICDTLVGPLKFEPFIEVAVRDTDALEPLIDDMTEQAELRGRFQQLLKDADALLRFENWRKEIA